MVGEMRNFVGTHVKSRAFGILRGSTRYMLAQISVRQLLQHAEWVLSRAEDSISVFRWD